MNGPEDQHPWDREDEEIRQAFAAKDAEIKRLKADVEYWHHIATVEKNGLITELCNALESCLYGGFAEAYPNDPRVKLLRRIREATTV